MDYNIISAYVANVMNDLVYISDIYTYEIYYINKTTLKALGNPDESDWKGRKCYNLLQGRSSPCEFCTNHKLKEGSFYEWEYYNPLIGKYFSLRDTIIDLNGKKARLEIATDITKRYLLEKNLNEKLELETVLITCVEMLHSADLPINSVNKLLQIIGGYYNAERSYIFELAPDKITCSNTYEWCAPGIIPQLGFLQNIPSTFLSRWFEKFEDEGEFFIASIEDELDPHSEEYLILSEQGITSLITAPLRDVDGQLTGFIGVDNPQKHLNNSSLIRAVARFIADFFDKNELINTLHNLSYSDTLTGLKNRHSYRHLLDDFERNTPDTLGVAYIDIKGLKAINDTRGHKFGDSLLIHLSTLLTDLFSHEVVYRIGGDEFVVFCQNISEKDFENSISEFRNQLKQESILKVSLGYAWNTSSDQDFKTKELQDAHSDEQTIFTKPHIKFDNELTFRSILIKNLVSEINNGRYIVYLQPQIDLETDRISGAEALVRRIDFDGNIQLPTVFIPFYEKEDIISHIDFFVFERVCQLLAKWKKNACEQDFKISVNFSRLSLARHGVEDELLEICQKYQVLPCKLVIEITETISSMDDVLLSRIIHNFTKLGFSVSLDDFGSGYSNLAIITTSDFTEIKIDKSLIDTLIENEKSKIITALAINVCEQLNDLESVAEGVETLEQKEMLVNMRCKKGQGYFFDRPLPIDMFEKKYL